MKKALLVSGLISFLMTGCATFSPVISEADKGAFFTPTSDAKLASLYLACGKHFINGEPPTVGSDVLPDCGFTINGTKYSKIKAEQVGRVDVPGGKITVDNIDGMDPLKTIEVKAGGSALLVSDWNQKINQTAMMFGLIGALYDAATTDRSKLNGPLTIYDGDFKQRVSGLTPVKLQAVK